MFVIHVILQAVISAVLHSDLGWQLNVWCCWGPIYTAQNVWKTFFDIAPLPAGVASVTFYF